MGIREVMVILGGRSIGDIVELLADGERLRPRPDVPLPARRARASRTPSAWRATSWATTASASCWATTSCAAQALADVAAEFEAGPWGAGTLLYQVADPERFGVAEFAADGAIVGFEEKPARPKSDLIPIGVYFLRPDAFDVIEHLAPSGRGEFEITDVLNHYIPDGGLFWRDYEGHWSDAGTIDSLQLAAHFAAEDDAAGRLAPPPQRP